MDADVASPLTTVSAGIVSCGRRLPSTSTSCGCTESPATARCIASMVAPRMFSSSISATVADATQYARQADCTSAREIPAFFCHLLAVIQPFDQWLGRIQYYRRRIDISCERASASFIDTAEQQATAPFFRVPRVQFLGGLFRCSLCHYSASCSGSSSVILPSLPLRNSSSSVIAARSVFTLPPEISMPRFRPSSSSMAKPSSCIACRSVMR